MRRSWPRSQRASNPKVAHKCNPDARVLYVKNDRCKSGCAHMWSLFKDA